METKYKNKKIETDKIDGIEIKSGDLIGYQVEDETENGIYEVSIAEPIETNEITINKNEVVAIAYEIPPKKKKTFKVFTVNNGKY